mgnify:CR=1 FL=1
MTEYYFIGAVLLGVIGALMFTVAIVGAYLEGEAC